MGADDNDLHKVYGSVSFFLLLFLVPELDSTLNAAVGVRRLTAGHLSRFSGHQPPSNKEETASNKLTPLQERFRRRRSDLRTTMVSNTHEATASDKDDAMGGREREEWRGEERRGGIRRRRSACRACSALRR